MKRLLSVFLMIAMILTACGSADTAAEQPEQKVPADDPAQTEAPHAPIDLPALLTTGMWDSSAGDLYYDFSPNGTGRILDPGGFGTAGTFTYSVDNNTVVLEMQQNSSEVWTFAQDTNTFICQSAESEKTVTQTAAQDVYTEWADGITRFADAGSEQWMTQLDMNQGSHQVYQYWDQLLNEVYQYLHRVLPDAEFRALQEDEKVWITQKESAVQAAGAEYEGGSMQPLVENSAAAEWTEDRVRYLIDLIPQT